MNKNVIRLRFSFSILFLSLLASVSFAQGTNDTVQDQITNNQEAGMADLMLISINLPALQEVGGSPFLNNDYKLGSVQLSADKKVMNVPVKFNIYNNAVMVQREGKEMKLITFDQVSYDVPGNNGEVEHYYFKLGYPEIDNHPRTAIYQVLAFGPKVHLLKFLSQKVEDRPTLGDYSRREIVTTQQLYIYFPGGEIKKLKTGKKSVMEALPGMSEKIEEAIKAGDLNLKNESDIAKLVNELNK